jgi:hypothetical protein
MAVNNWDVLKEMGERGSPKLEMAPLDNIIRINYYAKRGTEITIGTPGNRTLAFERAEYCGGLILADRKEFGEVAAELEELSRSSICVCCRQPILPDVMSKPASANLKCELCDQRASFIQHRRALCVDHASLRKGDNQ